jgi:hypothetical protein
MKIRASICLLLLSCATTADATVSVGSAPEGDAKAVAARIIKYNFPRCKHIATAVRLNDGSIRATCDGKDYRVFTMYSSEKGKMIEVALNCTAAKQHGIDCY